MVQKAYEVYLKGSFITCKHRADEPIVSLMVTCKREFLSLESLNMEGLPDNPCRAKVEFVVMATGPESYDAVFDDASEILFGMEGDFEKFRIRSYHDPQAMPDPGE